MRKWFKKQAATDNSPTASEQAALAAALHSPTAVVHYSPDMMDADPYEGTMVVDYSVALTGDIPPPSRSPVELAPPDLDQVGNYKLHGILGEGGMAIVYVAEQMGRPGFQYALKMMREVDEDFDSQQRFEREILIGLQFSHPNICRVVDWGRSENHNFYLVMELLQGETLLHYIERLAPMPLRVARPIIEQILTALAAIHQQGIVHRDLKPVNIFITSDSVVKIMDFGIARSQKLGSVTRTGTSIGSIHYMSPEQLKDSKHVDHRTDLFNLGLISYLMLTGHLPLEGPLSSVVLGLVQGDMKPISHWRKDLPAGVEAWVHRLLKRLPDERFQTAQEALQVMGG